ncbi:MAG: 4Fe-4S binding protein, partial [Armatimonadetes bacterium]|nr:4Fe-4S binding protein [Armatimonadota bacterium]
HLMAGADILAEKLCALAIAKASVSVPVIVKITPQLERPDLVARRLEKGGADAVVMFNRFTGLDIDIEAQRPVLHGGYAGHGGPWAIHYVLRWLTATYPVLSIPIAASGGAFSSSAVIKLILAGATVVQVCSAIIVNGYEVIGDMVSGLADYLDRAGADSVADIRGRVCDRIVPAENVDRRLTVFAQVAPEACTGCGRCEKVCIYGAVVAEGGRFTIDPERCDGCGLCAELCPARAISIMPRPSPVQR